MSHYFNDSPIESPSDDRYGMSPFAQAIAKSILNIRSPVGTTIALNGAWGSGKSSVINLIRNALEANKDELVITEFKCFWYRGEEQLALAFLQNLHTVLQESLGRKVRNLIPNIARRIFQAGPVIGEVISLASGAPWIAPLGSAASSFIKTFFPEGKTVEEIFEQLSQVLSKQKKRFLVIIDDIDRLSEEEALAIFRLIKSVGRLPNVLYLLAFDRDLADAAVQKRYPSEGPHFLEKIIQAAFEIPPPLQIDLNFSALAAIERTCGSPKEGELKTVLNHFHDGVVPYITLPRHVVRFENAISVTWPAIAGDVNLADFIALEALRLYEPSLYKAIRLNKNELCGTRQQQDPPARDDNRFNPYISAVPSARHRTVKTILQRLFPRLAEMGYGSEFLSIWDSERRVCIEKHFDSYFRLSLRDDVLSMRTIDALVEHTNDRQFIQQTFRGAATQQRRGGRSMVPIYLDALITHAGRVDKPNASTLIALLFTIHDEIDLQKDDERGFGSITNTSLQYHWLIRRLTTDRFSLEERTQLYTHALRTSALGWLVDFVSSARDDYDEKRPTSENDRLVSKDAVPPLTEQALNAIRAAATDGSLIHHRHLLHILYRWRDFRDGDATEVRAWTSQIVQDDNNLAILARAMTSETWSFGMGGFGSLGDRISMPAVRAQISDDTDIVDVAAFRAGLDRILQERKLEDDALRVIKTFVEAWDGQRKGRQDD